ncbi:ImmA/IrrE family metallo-endopeptidase [Butyrivibrio hungatei]|uniref:IrrE N-terminal-like domain-containing protein n=1 Tax=Butyrivibrio hungatei TaxID=185008 RepID=A0A1D9NY61_9FIRM|nr:ImmA/IrrE family metallo-endopeptidase [Butyrivibrio hungatei]AOZ95328.1 hypothetical protein bhn_I0294 [Butyrivibrio hungatei]
MTCRKPDFKKVYTLANEILVSNKSIDTFPYSIKKLVKEQSDIQTCSFSKAEEKYHIPIKNFGSESAHLEQYLGASIIFYNEKEPKYRIRFDLGHEFGHFMLGHETDLAKDNPLYAIQEIEANCFAAQLLMPEQLIRECGNRGYTITPDFIRRAFEVSDAAASMRKATLAKTNYEWRDRTEKLFDDIIISRYGDFLDKVAPKRRIEIFNSFYYDEEFDKQRERDSWLDPRRR